MQLTICLAMHIYFCIKFLYPATHFTHGVTQFRPANHPLETTALENAVAEIKRVLQWPLITFTFLHLGHLDDAYIQSDLQ